MAKYNNETPDTIITGTASADTITNSGANVTINGSAGADDIFNLDGKNVKIDGGAGDYYIKNGRILYSWTANSGDGLTINGGAGSDLIYNYSGDKTLINGGTGNDILSTAPVKETRLTAGRVTIPFTPAISMCTETNIAAVP